MLTTMESKKILQIDTTMRSILSNRGASVFVWSVWLIMMLVALICTFKYGRNIPLSEDWFFVQPLTNNEPDLSAWLWRQNSEHRVPLPRLILLGLLKLTNGDFRIGMVFNVVTLGAISFAVILVARHMRGGRTSFADAFFPIILLHLGNWQNLFWSWQIGFVLPTALTLTLLLVLVRYQTLTTPVAALISGFSLMMLPLCGANGLLIVPITAFWLIYTGVLHLHSEKRSGGHLWVSAFLIGSAGVALCLSALYFVGYQRPSWVPLSHSIPKVLIIAAKFLALGLGPVANSSWKLSTLVVMSFLIPSAVLGILRVLHDNYSERQRSLGILLYLGNLASFALALGVGRAEVIGMHGYEGLPGWYVLLAVPALCTAFFIWELYGWANLKSFVQYALFFTMLILLPFNTKWGLGWGRNYYGKGMHAVEKDLLAGTPLTTLAERHRDFLIHWMDKGELANLMQMLHDANMGPFAQMLRDQSKQGY